MDLDSDNSEDEEDVDTIDAYLNSPKISKKEIEKCGGVLGYWERERTTRPRVAQMALDFLSAPGI